MVENRVEYNQRGRIKSSPRGRSRRRNTPSPLVRGVVGLRSRRRRRHRRLSPAIYDGGRRRRTIRRKNNV
jgi:hypothetical protein